MSNNQLMIDLTYTKDEQFKEPNRISEQTNVYLVNQSKKPNKMSKQMNVPLLIRQNIAWIGKGTQRSLTYS